MIWKRLGLIVWLTVLSVCDVRKKSVPLWLLWIGAVLGSVMLLHQTRQGEVQILPLLKAILPGAMLFFLALGTGKAGCADGLILIVLGLAEGYPDSLVICMSSLALAAFFSGILLLAKKAGRSTRIPFVPFLEAGWIVATCGEWGVL